MSRLLVYIGETTDLGFVLRCTQSTSTACRGRVKDGVMLDGMYPDQKGGPPEQETGAEADPHGTGLCPAPSP